MPKLLVACLFLVLGCVRDPLPKNCPPLSGGELVITELRGSGQGGTYGEWIEIYNASGAAIDLAGLRVEWDRDDLESGIASEARAFLVHRAGIELSAGQYAVLGRFESGSEPAHVDYGYLPIGCLSAGCDVDYTLYEIDTGTTVEYDRATVSLWACETLVDQVHYLRRPTAVSLPNPGTWGLDGALTPQADGNDDLRLWCADTDASDEDPTQIGIRGTPKKANRMCN